MATTKDVDQYIKKMMEDPSYKEVLELEEEKAKIVAPIIEFRSKNKLTQGKLAKIIGVSQQHISNVENGIFSSITTLQKILSFIGLRVTMQIEPIKRVRNRRVVRRAQAV